MSFYDKFHLDEEERDLLSYHLIVSKQSSSSQDYPFAHSWPVPFQLLVADKANQRYSWVSSNVEAITRTFSSALQQLNNLQTFDCVKNMVIIRVSLMVFFAWLASFFLGQAALSQSQQVAKYNRAGFFPYLKRFPALPSQYLKRSDMNNMLGIGVKRDDDQFDREDRDYRPLMFGKRYPDYQLPMFG
ncbi:hypothetical protein T10_13654 [Trichinella papuae]|uniref:Uncharacterized protein n=1 Tax=Trichinella papuae TaxID=268474 RepID=A0A0V1M871_9BILA|nr:hypothetical protein T10_13654 [Trichinella papuae]